MLDIQRYIWVPKVVTSKLDDGTDRYEVMYLPRWFWHTLWNAFRRIMLWYDFGAAITGLKINWYTHEYQVIEWMKETIIDFMLNLKKLRFKLDENTDSVVRVSQKFSWVWKYYSKDLDLPSDIEVLWKDDYICEITDPNLKLQFELRIEKGYWYYSIEFLKNREKQSENDEVWLILIDNDFRVVDSVKYTVEEVIDDFAWSMKDKLIIDVKMKYDTVSSKDFMAFAWEVLASYAKMFIFEDAYIDKSVLVDYESLNSWFGGDVEEEPKVTMPIDALPLSERTRNALIKNNILYVEDLEKKTKWELLIMKWVWKKAIDEINSALANMWKQLAG